MTRGWMLAPLLVIACGDPVKHATAPLADSQPRNGPAVGAVKDLAESGCELSADGHTVYTDDFQTPRMKLDGKRISGGGVDDQVLRRHWVVTLEVPGRKSGRALSFPLIVAEHEDKRYLVAMLGEGTNWVANVRAAGLRAVLRHGRREEVRLEEVAVSERAPILRRYLNVAPGARPHIPVDRRAALADFERIAPQYPVFRICSDADTSPARARRTDS